MTSREQFEAECRNGLINGGLAKHENGKYASELTDAVWRGWQASRKAVEVELPSLKQIDSGERYVWSDGVFNFKEDAIKAIRAAGIKVKGA